MLITNARKSQAESRQLAFFNEHIANTSITLYNKYKSGRDELYQLTTIDDVGWDESIKSVANKTVDDSAKIEIPVTITGYMTPDEWVVGSGWTLQRDDIIVKGDVDDIIFSGFTVSDLERKYSNVFRITSVEDTERVVGLNYLVVGVK